MTKWLVPTLAACLLCVAPSAHAETLTLPAPDIRGGKPLMQALNERQSARHFSARPLSDRLLGDLLWAACGVNRHDGRRTIPTALNRQDVEIYVLRADGAWLYDAPRHTLERAGEDDLRGFLGAQSFAREAPVTLLYVSDTEKNADELYAAMHAGSAYQNVGLFCASVGLNNVVRASHDAKALAEGLKLPARKRIVVSQSLGWGE